MEPGTIFSNKRWLSVLFALIKSKTFITSAELSSLLNVSERTIKRDILNLKDINISYGFEIEARRGSGYCINIIDNSRFESFQSQLFSKYTHINEIVVSQAKSRSEQLLIILLSTNRYLSVHELSNTLYLNSRTITILLRQIKPILEHYNLSLQSKPNHGLRIEGAEIHRRICMTDTYMNFIESKLSKSIEGSLETLLGCSLPSFSKVKNVIIETSLKYEKKIENHKLQKFPYLLALTYNRARQGKRATIDNVSFTYFRHFPEYTIIEEIVSQTNKIVNFELSPNEILVLALVYFTYVDFYIDYLSNDYAYFYDKALTYEKGIRKFLTQKTGLVFDHLTQFRKNLVIFLFPFYLKQQLMLVDTNPWHNYSRNYLRTFDQISIDLAILAANYLKRLTKYMLCNDDIIQLAVIFNNAFTERSSTNYQLDLKIAIKIDNNFRMVYQAYEYLQICKYRDYIQKIDLLHAYEISEIDQLLRYDMVFAEKDLNNSPEFANLLKEKCFWLPDLRERGNYYLIERYISHVIHLDMFKSYSPKDLKIIVDNRKTIHSKHDFFKLVADSLPGSNGERRAFKQFLAQRENLISYETELGIAIINSFSDRFPNSIHIHPLVSSIKWKSTDVGTIIHFNIANLPNITFLEFVTRFYKKIVSDPIYLTNLIANGNRMILDKDFFDILA